MASNSFGKHFVLTSFGESHGKAMGVVIDGCPSGVRFDTDLLQSNLIRRRPGKHQKSENFQSDREEKDLAEVLSGVFEAKTLGTPIAILSNNSDQKSQDYSEIKSKPRPGHADDTWKEKYQHTDHRGGGRSSARETISRVMAGSVAEMFLNQVYPNLSIKTYVSEVAGNEISEETRSDLKINEMNTKDFRNFVDKSPLRIPDANLSTKMEEKIREAKQRGESFGGYVEVRIKAAPKSLGQAVFHKLKADFASAFLGIGAVNSFEMGESRILNQSEGSAIHKMEDKSGSIYGGVRGGFSTGEDIFMRIGFKPTSSVLSVATKGRHDPCILPRAVPVIEAMAHLVLADHVLWSRLDRV